MWFIENENFDAYMAAIGVGWVLRKAGAAASSTTAITDEGKIPQKWPLFDLQMTHNLTFICHTLDKITQMFTQTRKPCKSYF